MLYPKGFNIHTIKREIHISGGKPDFEGGEAHLYKIRFKGNNLAKIYKSELGIDRKSYHKKFAKYPNLESKPQFLYPKVLAFHDRNLTDLAGYIMTLVDSPTPFHTYCGRKGRKILGVTIEDVTRYLLQVFDDLMFLHNNPEEPIIVGDLNTRTLIVKDGIVYWSDCDSWQLEGFPCKVFQWNTIDPKIANINTKEKNAQDAVSKIGNYSKETDIYSFAVLVIQALFGVHPYEGVCPTIPSVVKRMSEGITIFRDNVNFPGKKQMMQLLPQPLIEHLQNIIENGIRTFDRTLLTSIFGTNCDIEMESDDRIIASSLHNDKIEYCKKRNQNFITSNKLPIPADYNIIGWFDGKEIACIKRENKTRHIHYVSSSGSQDVTVHHPFPAVSANGVYYLEDEIVFYQPKSGRTLARNFSLNVSSNASLVSTGKRAILIGKFCYLLEPNMKVSATEIKGLIDINALNSYCCFDSGKEVIIYLDIFDIAMKRRHLLIIINEDIKIHDVSSHPKIQNTTAITIGNNVIFIANPSGIHSFNFALKHQKSYEFDQVVINLHFLNESLKVTTSKGIYSQSI